MSLAAIKSHFSNWREWEFNPIVIKELRQAVRSWAVTGMLLLFLIVLFITSLVFLVGQSFVVDENTQLGGTMFSAFVVILAGASGLFIPLYVGVRVAAERQENNHDLLYVSTLSPFRIVLGKFLCGAYMAVLFFSACMPFMAFTNLLRGVDLPTVFLILAFLFLVVCAANMIAIFLACLPMSRPFKFLFVIYGLFQSAGIVGSLILNSLMMMRSGVGAMFAAKTFWINVATVGGIGVAVTGLFFILTVALVSPPSSNRALPIRIYLAALWVLGGLLSLGWVVKTGDASRMLAWTYPTFAVMMIALLVVVSNTDQLSHRVRRTIPQAGWKRTLAFVFYNGAAGGLAWVAVILTVTIYITLEIGKQAPKTVSTPAINGSWFATTIAYAFAYALTALFIHRKFFPHRPPKIAGVLAILLAGGWALIPSFVLFFMNRLSWKSVEGLQLGNVFNVASLHDDDQRIYHLYFAFGWLLLMLAINAKWFVQQVRNFRPPSPQPSGDSPVASQ